MNPLNKIYRTIWSEALGAWVAVSELVKSKGKRAVSSLERVLNIGGVDAATDDIHRHRFKLTALAALCLFSLGAQANPMGGQVVSGSASFNTSGNTLTVTNTPGAIIHWQDFSIQQNEITRFAQQSASSAVLNRVVGGNTSQILGSLQSNGRVFLVNPSGIVFGAGSTVDVAGLVATSLNLSDADFLAGRHRFSNDPNAQAVRNAGNISAQQGGEIWLIAPNVENSGVINAPNGEILLAAGASVELTNSLDPNLRVNITAPAGDATNVGQLVASAGRLGLFGTLVRNSGSVSADSATMQGGKIVFRSSQRTEVSGSASAQGAGGGEIKVLSDMGQGTVEVSGTLDASAPKQGDGGFVDTSAAHVLVNDGARISTLAANGKSGNWLIDPTDFYVSATDPANGSSWMDNTTLSANLGLGNITIQTLATGAGNGDIFINDTVSWSTSSTLTLNAHRDVNINPLISNTGAGGLRIRADLNGTGTGTINFAGIGSVSLTAGAADFYYNPTVFGTPNNYTAKVTGTLREWMLVSNAANLQAINTNLAGNYALGRNIDASSIPSFVPLGNTTTTFTGQFDGLGHTVSNLSIPTPAANQVGLFGVIGATGTVKDLGLTSVAIQGNSSVGALAGINFGTIFNTYVSGGSVQGGNGAAGGLVGVNQGGDGSAAVGTTPGTAGSNASISNSYAEKVAVSVTAAVSPAVGGLVGINRGGAGGAGGGASISAPGGVGGAGGAAIITNSYVSGGSVSGMGAFTTQFAGGLVGQNLGGNGGNGANGSTSMNVAGAGGGGGAASISNSYASTGIVSASRVGGLIGNNLSGAVGVAGTGILPGGPGPAGLASATTVAWDSVTTGQAVPIGSGNQDTVVNISATPYSQAAYTGFDFTNTWWISESNTRPFLRSEWSTTIANPHQLQLMTMNLTASYMLTNNIDMAPALAAGGMWGSAGFVPVLSFSGALNGQGYTVNNLYINRPATTDIGLFSALSMGSSVSNLGLVGGSVTGNWRVGSLAGISDATITNCYVSGMNVSEAGASTLGGLVAQNGFYGSIVNSFVDSGTITGSGRWIGGLAGLNYGVIDGSHVANSVVNGGTLGGSVGGMVGWNASGGSITNSYVNTGNVFGRTSVGGLVGWNSGSIGNSYNSGGSVSGTGSVGGVVGYNSSTIDAAFATGVAVTGNSTVGGFAGAAYGAISNSYAAGGSVTGSNLFGGFAGAMSSGAISNSHYNISSMTINGSTGTMVTPYGLYNDVLNTSATGQFSDWLADSTLNIADYSNVLPGGVGNHTVGSLDGMKALLGFSEDSTLNFTLTSSLNLTALPGYYVPVLGANFDGGSFTISNLSINQSTSDYLGLFGHVLSGTTVSNVVLQNATVNGSLNVGALAGWNEGDILNSSSTNGVIAGNSSVGGLVGYNKNPYLYSVCSGTCTNPPTGGNISNSFVSGGTVQGAFTNVGGLVGHSFGGTVDTSYVTGGNVSGSSGIGGLVGSDGGEGGFISISNSYVSNTLVSGVSDAGGLAGWLNGSISGSHVTGGSVSGNSNIGGMIGRLGLGSIASSPNNFISNSYVDLGTITGASSNIGGLAGSSQGNIDGSHVMNSAVLGSAQFSAVVGGLVGHNIAGSISNSYVDGGSVQGVGLVGGLVGRNEGGVGGWGSNITFPGLPGTAASISNSFVTGGTITGGGGDIGGLVGLNIKGLQGGGAYGGVGGDALISDSYVSGSSVSGSTSANLGGLVGRNNSVIGTSYTSIGTLSGGGNMGAVVGSNDMGGSVTGTFWDNTILGAGVTGIGFDYNTFGPTDVGAAPLDAVGMTTMSNFTNAGWSIANTGGAGMTWRIYEGHTGPLLTSFLTQTTVTANDATKVYDGIAYSGDNGYSTSVAGALLLGSIGGSSQGAVNAGSYVFDVTGLYSSQLGYDITGYTNGTLTITPAGITLLSITASDASKVYGDTYTFNGSAFIPVGLLGGDTIGSVTLSSAGAVSSANAGTYAITPSNAVFTVGSASNYSISYVNGTLTVTPRSITLSAPSLTRTYNGTTSYTATTAQLAAFSSALVSGDVVNAADMSYADKNAGTNKVVNFNSVAINDGNGGGNYSVTLVGNSTSTIDPASLVVTALPAQKVMNAGDPAIFPYSVVNLFDPVATVLSGTLARDPGELIGEYAIKQGSLTLLDTQNYTMTFVPGKFSIMAPAVVQEITQVAFSSGTPESDTTEEEKEKEEEQVLAEADIGNDQGSGLPDNLPVCR